MQVFFHLLCGKARKRSPKRLAVRRPLQRADGLVKSIGMSGVSKSQVSRLCGELDERSGSPHLIHHKFTLNGRCPGIA